MQLCPSLFSYLSADASPPAEGEDNPQPFSPKIVTKKVNTHI